MRKISALIICATLLWGCTTLNKNYKLGTQYAMTKNWDKAIALYEKAMLEDPSNSYYRLAWIRATISASNIHLSEARKLIDADEYAAGMAEYDKALSYDPDNRLILNEARRAMKQEEKKNQPAPAAGIYDPPVQLDVSGELITLSFPRDVSLKSIFQALAKYAEVNIIFEESFRDKPFSLDLSDMPFDQALARLCMASKCFSRVVDSKTVLVILDNPQNRMKYEETAIKTFYLANIEAQDVQQALMQLVRSQQMIPTISHNKVLNSVTVKTTPDKLQLAEQLIQIWDKPKSEIIIELEIMEVQRQKLRNLGMELDNYSAGVSYTAGVDDAGWLSPKGLDFGKTENYSITLPSAFLKFLETDSETKQIAQPQLRGVHGEKIEYMVGDEVPVPQTTFQPFAGGGVASQPIVNYEYKNVGIEIVITPTIHSSDEVSLEMDLKIKSLAGSGLGGLPIISSRQIKNVMRLRDGETNLLAGLLKDQERKTLKGIPGIKELPIIGKLFSYTDQEIQQNDVIMTVTPYIIRSLELEDSDRLPLWLPLEGISSEGGGERLPRTPGTSGDDMMDVVQRERGEDATGSNRIMLSPPGYETGAGREVRVNVSMVTQDEIHNMTLNFAFNPQVLKLKSIIRGNVLSRLGGDAAMLENIDNASGAAIVGFTSPQMNQGFKGSGNIVTLVFDALESGECQVAVSSISANGVRGQPVNFDASTSTIRIR